jgi:hypothetical protein
MTRKEWFDKQTPEVQEQFKLNCNTLNPELEFDWWISQSEELTYAIGGAFVWADSEQGHRYWSEINEKYENDIKAI